MLVEETSVEDVEVARRSIAVFRRSVYVSHLPSATSVVIGCPRFQDFSADQSRYEGDDCVLHQQVVRAALRLKSYNYNSHIRSKCQAQTHPSKISTPVQCIHTCASYTHRSHSAAAPDASESSPSGLDEPSLAKLSTFWNGEQRESSKHMLPSMQRGEIDAKAGL